MKNVFKLFGLFTLITVIGFSMLGCGNPTGSSTTGGGGGGSTTVEFTSWNGTYSGAGGRSVGITGGNTLTLNNFVSQEIQAVEGNGPFTFTLDGEGEIKYGDASGQVIGKYEYVNISLNRKGILTYIGHDGQNYYNLGLGIKDGSGAMEMITSFESEGAYFDPPISYIGMSNGYGWAGDR